jgi:two-component system cell cycle sensor histidine kinase/response regulator CckA
VLEAANGQDAVAASDGHDAPIDLLITDVVMPKMSGRGAAERLARTRPAMRQIFMSGHTEDVIVHQGVKSTAGHFLHKPFSRKPY